MNDKRKVGSGSGSDDSEVQESAALGPEDDDQELTLPSRHKVAKLLPLHTVMGASKGVTRQVGRPRKVQTKPTASDLEYHAQMAEEKAEFIETDAVVRAIQNGADAAEMLRRVKEEVAREAASLAFQRIENEKIGRDSSQVSTRRIDALKKVAEIELEIKRMGADTINLRSERMQKLFAFLIDAFREGCVSIGLSVEQIDLLFNHLGTNLEGWEEQAADLVK